jgi:hypothetical protein
MFHLIVFIVQKLIRSQSRGRRVGPNLINQESLLLNIRRDLPKEPWAVAGEWRSRADLAMGKTKNLGKTIS